jgi:hypothetical protein
MQFKLTNSFDDNLSLFQAEVERIDADCARILFDNIVPLCREGDAARDRAVISDFHKAVLKALNNLRTHSEEDKA